MFLRASAPPRHVFESQCNGIRILSPAPRPGLDSSSKSALSDRALRFKLAWRRAGILILHSGLIAMMLGEFFTGLFAVEGRMTIVEGYASNFVEKDRHYELAIVDRADSKVDDECCVPGSHSYLQAACF